MMVVGVRVELPHVMPVDGLKRGDARQKHRGISRSAAYANISAAVVTARISRSDFGTVLARYAIASATC
jgi:hypothetical protein